MKAGISGQRASRSGIDRLRILAIAAGIIWSVLFVVAGLHYELQMYGDGSIFSYSVAVQDAWGFHYHNISGRLFVYLSSFLPAETYVALSKDARGGIVVYGLLFFVAQLLGLAATFAADRSRGRVIFSYACFSAALLCPLVFGAPTEMWMAHALFWPALAVCHYARKGVAEAALIFVLLLALVFTHEGAVIFAFAILATLLLRGKRDLAFRRAAGALLVAMPIWVAVKIAFPPDDYIADVLVHNALHVFDIEILAGGLVILLLAAFASYAVIFLVLRWLDVSNAHIVAAAVVAAALAIYWLWFDQAFHSQNRYFLRTLILAGTPVLGVLAAAYALAAGGQLNPPVAMLPRLMAALTNWVAVRAATGAFLLAMLIHAVETAKFTTAWTDYKVAVRALATGAASDPALGDPRFVSSHRIGGKLNRLSWDSTTHFLSVLVSPNFAPARLVVDPTASYFWLSCKTATESLAAGRAVPAQSRRLVRIHACLHR